MPTIGNCLWAEKGKSEAFFENYLYLFQKKITFTETVHITKFSFGIFAATEEEKSLDWIPIIYKYSEPTETLSLVYSHPTQIHSSWTEKKAEISATLDIYLVPGSYIFGFTSCSQSDYFWIYEGSSQSPNTEIRFLKKSISNCSSPPDLLGTYEKSLSSAYWFFCVEYSTPDLTEMEVVSNVSNTPFKISGSKIYGFEDWFLTDFSGSYPTGNTFTLEASEVFQPYKFDEIGPSSVAVTETFVRTPASRATSFTSTVPS